MEEQTREFTENQNEEIPYVQGEVFEIDAEGYIVDNYIAMIDAEGNILDEDKQHLIYTGQNVYMFLIAKYNFETKLFEESYEFPEVDLEEEKLNSLKPTPEEIEQANFEVKVITLLEELEVI